MVNAPALPSNSATMSSVEISKLTGKEHRNVLADIRTMFLALYGDAGYAEFSAVYKNQQGMEFPCFNLPKREALILTSGYSIKQRAAIIDRWQELEAKQAFQIPQTFSAALRLAGELQEQVETLTLEAKNNAPKVEFALAVRNLEGSCSIGEFAALIGIGRNTFFKQLRQDKILMINNRPYQEFKDRGLLVEVESTPYTDHNGVAQPAFQSRVTGKGQVFLEKKYRSAKPEGRAA